MPVLRKYIGLLCWFALFVYVGFALAVCKLPTGLMLACLRGVHAGLFGLTNSLEAVAGVGGSPALAELLGLRVPLTTLSGLAARAQLAQRAP